MADDVQVRFGAQLEGLVAGIEEAKVQLQTLTEPIAGIKSAFSDLAEFAVGALAIEGITEFEERFAKAGTEIQRTAQIIGATTDEVQEFQFAAKQSGEDSDTAAMALQRFGRIMAEAATGSGKAAEAYKNMGISVTDASGHLRPMMDVLGDVAEAFSKTADGATKLEYAQAIGSRGMANMIPMLDKGRAGLDELKKALDETGGKMSPEMIGKATELHHSLNMLDEAWRGMGNTIANIATPAYNSFIQGVTQDVEHLNRLTQLVAQITGGPAAPPLMTPSATAGGAVNYGEQFGPPAPAKPELPALSAGSGGTDKDKLALDDIKTDEQIAKLKLQMQKDELDQEVTLGKESKAQELGDLQNLLGQEYDAELAALEQKKSLYAEGSDEYEEALNQEDVLLQKYLADYQKVSEQIAQATAEQVKKTQAEYKSFFDTIDKDMDSMLQGILQGTQSWEQAMDKMIGNLVVSFIEGIAKMMVKWAAFEAAQAAFGSGDQMTQALGAGVPTVMGGSQQNSVLNAAITKLATVLGLNTAAHTAGTVATTGNTVATTSDSVATATGAVASSGLTVATTANTVASSADAASNISQLGLNTVDTSTNTAAIAANTTALFASKALPSFDVGSWSVPENMVAQIHQGEMIIPAGPAAAIRSGGTLGAGAGATGGGGQFTININAIDTQTGASFLKNNASTIAQVIAGQIRNFNPSLRG